MLKTINFPLVPKIPLKTGPRMNCLLFSDRMSTKCHKNKIRLSPRRIRTTKNHWSLKNLMFKANIWHPGLENARDHVKPNLLRSCSAGRGVAKLRFYQGLLLKPPLKIAFAYNNTVSTNEIYPDIHPCVLSLLLCFIFNFELNSCLRYIFIGKDFHA